MAGALLLVVVAGLSGCGDDDPAADGDQSAAPSTTAAGGGSLAAESGLAGRWAHYDVVAYEDAAMKTLIISYGITDFRVEGDDLIETDRFCHAEQRSNQPIETTISDAATQAIVPVDTPVELTATGDGYRVERPATPTGVGIDLADPANDPLPTDPADPRIVDDDGDGNPGITVTVKGAGGFEGEIYIARREIFATDMTTDGPDRLVGSVTDTSEQLVVGASNPVLATTTAWEQYPDPAKNPIVLVRAADDLDCEQLMAGRDGFFPPEPTVDW